MEAVIGDIFGLVGVGDYVLKEKIGEGAFSIVWKASHRRSREEVAVKQVILSKLNRSLQHCLDCELNFLSSVNHPNIIRLIDAFQAKGCIYLVFEFCCGGNLASFIKHTGRVQEHIARRFMQQLGAGLEVLHSHHMIHRDLKPENILLTSRESDGVLKIADFGLSSFPILETELYIQVNTRRRFVVPPYIWLQKFSNFKATMKRLICGVLVQFFLSFLMDTHHFVVELMFSFCRTLCHADVFPFLTLSFQI